MSDERDDLERERNHWRRLCVDLVMDRNIQSLEKDAPTNPLLPFLRGVRAGLRGEFRTDASAPMEPKGVGLTPIRGKPGPKPGRKPRLPPPTTEVVGTHVQVLDNGVYRSTEDET